MTCNSCKSLEKDIRSPSDLKNAIRITAGMCKLGELKYIGAGRWGDPFINISSGSGWGDLVSNYFQCSHCEQYFHLKAETYHGSGGRLEQILGIEDEVQNDQYPESR